MSGASRQLADRPRRSLLVVLGALAAFAPFTVDTYLPAFPAIAGDLRIPASAVQVTLAATTAGFAVGQLVAGPVSDRIGRRVPLLIGCAIHLIASIALLLSSDLAQLTAARALQGFGGASAAVVALATARDLFAGRALVRALAFVALISGIAPLIAPVVGSQLLRLGNWRVVFVFLAVYAALVLLTARAVVPETARLDRSAPRRGALPRYRLLLSSPAFLGVMVLGAARYTALFTFLQVSPFLFQRRLGLDAQAFGVVFAISTLGMMAGVQSSARLVRFAPATRLIGVSLLVIALSAGAIWLAGAAGWPAPALLACCVLFMLGCGLGLPMIQTLGLLDHPDEAGTAAALIGAASFGAPALLTPALAVLPDAVPMETTQLAIVWGATTVFAAGALIGVGAHSRRLRSRAPSPVGLLPPDA